MRFRVFLFFQKGRIFQAVCVVTTIFVLCFYDVTKMDRGEFRLRGDFREQNPSLRGLVKANHEGARVRSSATHVLILAYMRSGSSLVGQILQQATEAFYIFEPFHSLNKAKENGTIITYINGSKSSLPLDLNKEKNDAIYNWFTCDIQKISRGSFYDKLMKKARKSNQTLKCLSTNQNLPKRDREQKCADSLQESCVNSPIRIIKTIRTELASAGRLLKDLLNMKIIHLVRDPRATMYSKRDLRECHTWGDVIKGCTQRHCQRLQNDVVAMDRLVEKYPDRIRTFFYEDFALHPVETSERLFDFVGETFTESARNFVIKITSADRDNNRYGIYRSNSSEHVYTWKTNMEIMFRNDVQKACDYVFERFKDRYEII